MFFWKSMWSTWQSVLRGFNYFNLVNSEQIQYFAYMAITENDCDCNVINTNVYNYFSDLHWVNMCLQVIYEHWGSNSFFRTLVFAESNNPNPKAILPLINLFHLELVWFMAWFFFFLKRLNIHTQKTYYGGIIKTNITLGLFNNWLIFNEDKLLMRNYV